MIKSMLEFLATKSPIKIRKRLVYKFDLNTDLTTVELHNELDFQIITQELIEDNLSLQAHKDLLVSNLNAGFIGFAGFLENSSECIGYSWLTISKPPSNGIPKIPHGSGWLFTDYVFEKHRGNGFQKNLIKHRLDYLLKKGTQHIYVDIMVKNMPAIMSYKKFGFKESGIYYILIFGVRRFKYLHLIFNYWSNQKHPG